MEKKSDRREFIKRAGAGAAVVAAAKNLFASRPIAASTTSTNVPHPLSASSAARILGANDRINIGFVGCGGRMNAHIDYLVNRAKEKADVAAVAVNDIYERNKQQARERCGVAEKDVHHRYEELCARKDIDVVIVSSPDHWHHAHALEALKNGKDVYLEKPMTYTVDEAKDLAEYVTANRRVLQVGSQYTSLDHFHKARKAIADGLIGQVVWASGGFGRNSTKRGGEWNYYKIWPDANEQTVDWKAFLGTAPKRPFDTDRYFRWRKYWDYSGGIATDLFYHTLAPLLLSIGSDFPKRVIASGGIYVQKEKREVPDTFFMNVDYQSFTIQLACSVTSGLGAPLIIHGSEATVKISESSENPRNRTIEITPDRDYAEDFRKKAGSDKLVIDLEQSTDKHPHMANFLESVRTRQEPNLSAELGYQTMAAIGMGVKSYRQNRVYFFDKQKRKVTDRPVTG